MTAREELIEAIRRALLGNSQKAIELPQNKRSYSQLAVDALTPDLWLRYGLEMGWLRVAGHAQVDLIRGYAHSCGVVHIQLLEYWGNRNSEGEPIYRFTAGAEKERK